MPPVITLTPSGTGTPKPYQEFTRFAQIVGALTTAIDLAEGNRDCHALRTCIIAMRIGNRVSLDPQALSDLFYAALLKDIAGPRTQTRDMAVTGQGGLRARRLLREGRHGMPMRETLRAVQDLHSGKPRLERTRLRFKFLAKRKQLRYETVALRCAAASELLDTLGVSAGTRNAVCCMDEQWNGRGAPNGLRGSQIPLIAQIVKLAQTMEYFSAQGSTKHVMNWLHGRCKGWFDPALVAAATLLYESPSGWWHLDQRDLLAYTLTLEPKKHTLAATGDTIDRICEVFAAVADARSQYSSTHSAQVAEIAVRIGRVLDLGERQLNTLRRAALLHDVGKLAIPRHILERHGALTEDEIPLLRAYPLRTYEMLQRVPEFREVAQLAMSHHERLDGSGYPKGLKAEHIGLSARILAVADVAEALASQRSFRKKFSGQQIYNILMELTPHQLDAHCVNALLHNSVISLVA